jgi:hypothetical protein
VEIVSFSKSKTTMGCTHIGGLVERGGGSAGGDSRARAADLDVDALQFRLVSLDRTTRRVVVLT